MSMTMPARFGRGPLTPIFLPAAVRNAAEELIAKHADSEPASLLRSWLAAVGGEKPRFNLGLLVATPGALQAIPETEVRFALARHLLGDWGELDPHDWRENDAALAEGGRLLSAYVSRGGVSFWIITEWDRSVTTVLLPDEY